MARHKQTEQSNGATPTLPRRRGVLTGIALVALGAWVRCCR